MKRLVPLLAVAFAYAQNPPPLEIRGTVVEGVLGLAGATVTLYQFGSDPTTAATRTILATTSTDQKGAFQLHPSRAGDYYIEVKKEGYFAETFDGPTADATEIIGDSVSIDVDHTSQERRFSLTRLGELRGRVIDEDGKPVASLHIGLLPATSTQVETDEDGYFAATKLRPGRYVVRIGPEHSSPEILRQFAEEDLKVIDRELETSFWPGAGDIRTASPLSVSSGASLSIGTITARKATYYRAHLSIQPSDCAPDEDWLLTIRTSDASNFVPTRQVPCGKEVLVRNLIPGLYSFVVATTGERFGKDGKEKRWALASAVVTDQNIDVPMIMSPGAEISGKLVAAEGAALPEKTTVMVTPFVRGWGFVTLVSEQGGTFQIHSLPGDPSWARVSDMGDNFYTKEIRYNWISVTNCIFTPVVGPPILEIVIDDKAATIGGSVAERNKVVGQIRIMAVKWPLSPTDSLLPMLLGASVHTTPVDDQGRFRVSGLAPGEYRVVALTEDVATRTNLDSLIRLLSRAEKVNVDRGGSQNISLELADPSR